MARIPEVEIEAMIQLPTRPSRHWFVCMPRSVLCPVLLMTLVGGCAGSMGTMRPGPSIPASEAATISVVPPPPVTAFDGTYRVKIRSTGSFGAPSANSTSWCDSPGQPIITVANGQFTYKVSHPNVPGDASPVFPATVAADGSFAGEIVAGSIAGSIHGTNIEGRIDGSACLYAFSGSRQ